MLAMTSSCRKNRGPIWVLWWSLTAAAWLGAQEAATGVPDELRQAVHQVARDVQEALAQAPFPKGQPVSLLPIADDPQQYVAGLLKNAITASGHVYAEGQEDPMWERILAEIAWNERKADILDPATLTRFGQLKGIRFLMYGTVRDLAFDGRKGFVELELHVTSIETRHHVWGQVFARRIYADRDMQGVVELDEPARQVLQKVMAQAVESLRASPRLAAARTIILAPLSGDIDGYASELLAAEVTRLSTVTLRDSAVQTLDEARQVLRDDPAAADAILHGAMRDLSRETLSRDAQADRCRYRAEVQLRLVAAGSGDVLWAATVPASLDHAVPRQSLSEKAAGVVRDGVEERLQKAPGSFVRLAVRVAVGVALVLVALWILRLLVRPR